MQAASSTPHVRSGGRCFAMQESTSLIGESDIRRMLIGRERLHERG
ncbi:MAG: hypothetical protein R3F01_05350 [Lysobacteraceae bacterium]